MWYARARLAADEGYDMRDFVTELRQMGTTPHVAQNRGRRSARRALRKDKYKYEPS